MNFDEQRKCPSHASAALIILYEVKSLKSKGVWNLVVRRCQEAVELALKSALVFVGIQPPRVHDVGPTLKEHSEKFPPEFRQYITQLASISRALRAERELSFYGDEESGMPPETLYSLDDADEALRKAEFVLEKSQALIVGGK
ncbi:HEPN domain-containing protein [Fervidibacter sacchari]